MTTNKQGCPFANEGKSKVPQTRAQRYHRFVEKVMPHMDELRVDEAIDDYNHIDEIIFRKSEYLGGMAAVCISLARLEETMEESIQNLAAPVKK